MTVVRIVLPLSGRIFMGNRHLKLVVPTIDKRTVTPNRAKNSELRTREYLTEHEVEKLMAAARQNRYGHRDATMILIARWPRNVSVGAAGRNHLSEYSKYRTINNSSHLRTYC
jgi:hypothetical protein